MYKAHHTYGSLMLTVFFIVYMVFALTSCNHLNHRAIAQKHLDKIGLEICDTVTIRDTTTITESSTDTVFKHDTLNNDTIIIREGQSEVKYYYNRHDSTVFIEGKCHDTLIIKEREGQTKVVTNNNDSLYIWLTIANLLLLLLLIFAVWRLTR